MWTSTSLSHHFLIIIQVLVTSVTPFNLEWHYPIIIKHNSRLTPSPPPNYFGASVSFLKAEQGAAWVIIGSPKSNSSYPTHNGIIEPGAIWQCSLGQSVDTCRPVVMDSTGNNQTGNVVERKDDGFLGGPGGIAISHPGSRSFVACANRWEKREPEKGIAYLHGACYQRPRTDLMKNEITPVSKKLIPLGEAKIENNRLWRQGQAGFSVFLSHDGTEIVMGAPGFDAWRGSVIQYVSTDGGSTFQKSFISKPQKHQGQLASFSYFGYSVTSGYIFEMGVKNTGGVEGQTSESEKSGKMKAAFYQYAAGAPRGNELMGKVIIFRFPSKIGSDDPLEVIDEIRGDQTGAYFGATVLAMDVDSNGFADILIGAPRHSRDIQSHGSHKRGLDQDPPFDRLINPRDFDRFGGYGDEGAVFLYLSNGKTLTKQERILTGGNRPWSQFGTAMTSLGDLNRDGYQDFAVSAPFQDEGSGAVFIYHGRPGGLIRTYAQVIEGQKITLGFGQGQLKGFGFSLGGNEDIDNNGFNDLVIGSFNSSHAVVIRSQPIITVHGEVTSNLAKLPVNLQTFEVESCISYSGDYVPVNLLLGIKLRSDSVFRPPRVKVRAADTPSSYPFTDLFEYNVTVTQAGGKECKKFHAKVVESLETTGAPVTFAQDIFIPKPLVEQVKSRIMEIHPGGSFSVTGEKFEAFCKSCPMINKEKPSEFKLELPLAVECGDDNKCVSDLHLEVGFREKISQRGFLIGSSDTLTMDVTLTNHEETAIAPGVLISWWNLKLKRPPSDCAIYSDTGNTGNQITYRCSMGKLLEFEKSATATLEFDVSTLVVQENLEMELMFNLTAVTVSDLKNPETATETWVLALEAEADLHLEGSRFLEVFNMKTLSSYVTFRHTFDLSIDGPSPVGNVMVVFQLPVNLTEYSDSEGTFTVKVRGVTLNNPSLMTCQPTKGHYFQSDDFSQTPNSALGDLDDPDFDAAGIGGFIPKDNDLSRSSNSSLIEKDKLLIHCNSPHVDCMEVTCRANGPLRSRQDSEMILSFILDIESKTVRSLLKKHKVSQIQIESHGMLILPEAVKSVQPPGHKPDVADAITIIEKEGHRRVPKWIFILAVAIGCVILACVIFTLYFFGCFESQKKVKKGDDLVDGDGEEMVPLQENNGDLNDPPPGVAICPAKLPDEDYNKPKPVRKPTPALTPLVIAPPAKTIPTRNSQRESERYSIGDVMISPSTAGSEMTEPPTFIPPSLTVQKSLESHPTIPEEEETFEEAVNNLGNKNENVFEVEPLQSEQKDEERSVQENN